VEHLALGGETVFGPDLLVMNERALLRAEQIMLKCGERDWTTIFDLI
jgi:hypothetical protein